jgi:hypothetical protein
MVTDQWQQQQPCPLCAMWITSGWRVLLCWDRQCHLAADHPLICATCTRFRGGGGSLVTAWPTNENVHADDELCF